MSTATPTAPATEPIRPPEPGAIALRPLRLAATVGSHTVVDFFSFLFIPIMSVLEGRLHLTPGQGAVIISAGSVCSGFVQPLAAWLGDKLDTRVLGPLAFAVAVVAVSLVGHAQTFEHLLLIQVLGTLGIGAFHPTAAAAVGQLAGQRRSLGVSIFFCAGMAGGVLGNLLSPHMAAGWGLPAYTRLILPGLLAVVVMLWAIARVPHRHHDAHAQRAGWAPGEARARWTTVGLLYAGNILRFTINMMMVQLLIRWCEQLALARAGAGVLTDAVRESAAAVNGPMQAAMQLGMAAGGLSAGAFLRTHHEKGALVVVPIAGAAAIIAFPYAGALTDALGAPALLLTAAFLLAVATGVGYAGTVPVTVALAQRLLPHRTSLASGLMMGGAWGFAAMGPPIAQALINALGLTPTFLITGLGLAGAGVLSLGLPGKLLARISPH
ncbi:MAG: MFS transporter [Phycisphaerales bacterium]|nr:MFS transporter [Phycisphaerales bacterium]